ncbi:ComG operon protein 6 [Streptococcus thermophilus CNCM I-1630]|nr:ComG operon protein 6 [Streptococcus thermophilus CNCM I-1630]
MVKLEGNKLYVKKDNQDLAFGLSSASDFRNTNADGRGYQPMLFDVKSSKVSQKNQIVTIQVTLKNELQKEFCLCVLKKQVRGGVLLYALFMAGIFTLLLQVYLERVVASSRQNQAQIVASQSRLMAEMTMDLVDKEAGAFSFSQGTTTYEVKGKQVIVRVASKGQIKTYRYVKNQDSEIGNFPFLFDMIEDRRKS